MTFFSGLSISRKIFAIPVVAIVFFGIYLLLSYNVSHKNLTSIDSVYHIDFQALVIAKELLFDMERIDEGLTQAAMSGEQDTLDIALKRKEHVLTSIQNLRELPAPAEAVAIIEDGFIAYADVAFPLSQSLIDGSADFSLIGQQAEKKAEVYQNLAAILAGFISQRNKQFDTSFDAIAQSVKKQTMTGVLSGVLMAFFLLLIALPIALAIDRHLRAVVSSLERIASEDNGDLTQRIEARSQDEIGQLVHWFNQFIARLHDVITRLIQAFKPLEGLIGNIDGVADRMGAAIRDQKVDAQSAKDSVDAISHSVNNVEAFSIQAAEVANHSATVAIESSTTLTLAAEGVAHLAEDIEGAQQVISQLAEDVQQVGSVLEVINSIAEQTNLLALNAAIEAARAGEQGRGFAVVADEVRNLAIKTQQSTHEIETTILALKEAANRAVGVMKTSVSMAHEKGQLTHSAGVAIRTMTEEIKKINTMNQQISDVAKGQSHAVDKLSTVVSSMHQHTHQASLESEQLFTISRELVDVTRQASTQLKSFKVSGAG
ncbi:methyl-accepting chemotaxis protein [Marinagarivorans cellulosilyticus]|uniref:Methyl-accepting chemotaxis protein n=1 Tax=Marinagarivorans cellulosilyticus TaxID=2721545 RepID=A0AAN2BM02_9GAMM|nr:methyl-accepting chemotaxis protein [Marinagarivorans cellulosilyticus]BCD99555.1 methyl-accepting chemotaxis protein [Marinagarivorans cellulosilyticus]